MRGIRWVSATVLALALVAAILATPASAETQATRTLQEVRSGERSCESLSRTDLDRIGEQAMQRMVGSTAAHESMDSLMGDMMGGSWERRMHVALGERAAGCGGRLPARFGAVMSAVTMMSGRGATEYGPGMTGEGRGGDDDGPGMMGEDGYGSSARSDSSDGPSAALMVAIMAALIAAAALGVYWLSRGRGGPEPDSPLETLKRRYAAGELSDEQYRESKRLLEGS